MTWAFDADVLIYAADPNNPLGGATRRMLERLAPGDGLGSVLLIPELYLKPTRLGHSSALEALHAILACLELVEVTPTIAGRSADLGAAYGLRTVDAIHLATAVELRADHLLTNNRRDFKPGLIKEIDVVYPDGLP